MIGLVITSTSTQSVELDWDEPNDYGSSITGYHIEKSTTGQFSGEETDLEILSDKSAEICTWLQKSYVSASATLAAASSTSRSVF